jgi:hypothetical protein
MKHFMLSLFAAMFLAGVASAQQPHVINGKIESASASAGLQAAVRQAAGSGAGPVWVGYAVPITGTRPRTMCCFGSDELRVSGCCGGCRLESDNNNYNSSNDDNCAQDQPQTHALIFLRYSSSQLTRIRVFTPNCGIDASGTTIHWLTDARPRESVAMLTAFADPADNSSSRQIQDSAIFAIAIHDDPSADEALNRFVAAERPEKTRQKAAFWIAAERGKAGFLTLQKLARDDKDDHFRRQLAFDFTVTQEPEAINELIRMAHQDPDGGVRGQALFWMAQKAGKKVAGEISSAIENDPDTDVKKKAVFALTQIPGNEGVPKLIEVARNNRNPEVRKQAMFWLGQSHDPRALAFIEEVLTR